MKISILFTPTHVALLGLPKILGASVGELAALALRYFQLSIALSDFRVVVREGTVASNNTGMMNSSSLLLLLLLIILVTESF